MIKEIPASQLYIDGTSLITGAEKDVYKVAFGGLYVAAKFYRVTDQEGIYIDLPAAVQKEMDGYLTFRKSPLRLFTPRPLLYLRTPTRRVGIGVEWISGTTLVNLQDNSFNKQGLVSQLDDLRVLLLEIPSEGFNPDYDDFSESNLMVSTARGTLSFAECHADAITKDFNKDRYQRFVNREIDRMIEVYSE